MLLHSAGLPFQIMKRLRSDINSKQPNHRLREWTEELRELETKLKFGGAPRENRKTHQQGSSPREA